MNRLLAYTLAALPPVCRHYSLTLLRAADAVVDSSSTVSNQSFSTACKARLTDSG